MPASPQPQQIIALVVRHNTPGVEEPVSRIRDFLAGAGYRVVFEADTAANLALDNLESMTVAEIGVQAQIGIVVGGDGTMLGIAR
ncbi:MAG: NAD kinase, partial [Oxalobacteraceae bacterium]